MWARVVLVLVLIGGLLVVGVAGYGVHLVRASYPQTSGEIELDGLTSSVEVLRDDLGIPNIYADSLEDLFFAQGFVHAQDRFWEMDVRRHITAGRLSEMFGASQVPTDTFLRTLGWRRIAEEELTLLNDRSLQILDAYAAGVNAYLADRSGADLSLEYAVLALQNPDYVPDPWQPADSVAWLKALAWDLRGNMTDEISRAVISASMGIEATEELYPEYPYAEHRPIVEVGAVVDGRFNQEAISNAGSAPRAAMNVDYSAFAPAFASVTDGARLLAEVLGPSGPGIGSNSWVVAGEKTETGMPLLANDPHLAPAMPSLWYQSALRCRVLDDECNYDVAGWTMAGLPGVFIGHNASIAWGFTNLGPDVTDLVLHQVTDNTYLFDGEQVPLEIRTERIEVAGGEPVDIVIRSTQDGPIISGIEDIPVYDAVAADAPVPAPGSRTANTADVDPGANMAVALRWTALQPQPTFDAFDALNTATNWGEFREAARLLAVPAQNLLYADTTGQIGYQAPGRIPIREGYSGKWPIPGWTSEYAWTGYVPFDALPSVVDPPEGWIVTANQAVIGPNYPYFLTDDWSYGARSQRIVDLIESATAGGAMISADRMREIQMDNYNALAEFLVPRLLELPAPEGTESARELLVSWDYQQNADSAAAAFFNAVWAQMVERMFDSAADIELVQASGNDRYWQVIEKIWDDPTNVWWIDKTTPQADDRDALLAVAQTAAVQQLSDRLGSDPQSWRWGDLHTLEFTNQTLGTSGIAPIEMIFNRGPVPTSGGEATVNATGWTPSDGFDVDWVPSMRQVIDLSDFDASSWVNLTGNSGHAYNRNYSDQIDSWVSGEQFPWPYSRGAVEAATVNSLTLVPGPRDAN